MRGHYRGDGGISFSVTGIARQSLEEQEPSPLKLANGAWATFMNETGDGFTTSFKFIIGSGRRWNSADPLQRRVICIFALAGRIRRAAAQRVYEIIHAVPAVIDGIATTAVGLALQQPQFTRQNRKIRDADRTAHK